VFALFRKDVAWIKVLRQQILNRHPGRAVFLFNDGCLDLFTKYSQSNLNIASGKYA
jgi:prepilin-type processing-associated H-X9-DG protein